MTGSAPEVLDVRDLRVVSAGTVADIVAEVTFSLKAGDVLGLVGESGSGKTTLGLALLNHCRRGLAIAKGSRVTIAGRTLQDLGPEQQRSLRGPVICYVPQDPSSALNPALKIRTQLAECGTAGRKMSQARLDELLAEVKLPSTPSFLDSYPHQISGGQQQRVTIAMAFAKRPRVIVMDEPTTGLDVTTQAHVLDIVRQLCTRHGVAAVYISHDLAVVAALAQRVAVMYAGRIVEMGPVDEVLTRPRHPYTRALIAAVPDLGSGAVVHGIPGQAPEPGARPKGCSFAPRCASVIPACREEMPSYRAVSADHQVRCIKPVGDDTQTIISEPQIADGVSGKPLLEVSDLRARHGSTEILHGLNFVLEGRSCLAIVGKSGSGKTTLARCIAGLHSDFSGGLRFDGQDIAAGSRNRSAEVRRKVQYIFQNPYASLNPRRTIGQSIAATLSILEPVSRAECRERVAAVLRRVALPAATADRYPHQLSGGQRQRAAIARALIVNPTLLICDEVTSSLDVSIQAVIIELIDGLKREQGLSLLFVTHNLALVSSIAEKVAVLMAGQIVEMGKTAQVLGDSVSPETRKLLQDTPRLVKSGRLNPLPFR
jgi:peptide/nickel transport system ATP-binding protein